MKIDVVSGNNYTKNKSNIGFKATLPKIGAIPVQHDGWDRVYLTCKKHNKLQELKGILTRLKDAGEGVLGCVWKKHSTYPTFYSAKNSEDLATQVKPILDAYKGKDTVSSVSLVQKSKDVFAETYDVRMHSEVEHDLVVPSGVGDSKKECEGLLKTLDDIVTVGTVKNKVLFTNTEDFFANFREN